MRENKQIIAQSSAVIAGKIIAKRHDDFFIEMRDTVAEEGNERNMEEAAQSREEVNRLIQVKRDKLAELQAAGKDPFRITKYDITHHSAEIKDNFDTLEGTKVSVAGRLMQKRVMGKASFCNVQDLQGNIQSYVARDSVGEEVYAGFKKFDVGDIVGIKGEVFLSSINIYAPTSPL